jgi:hypothetical protein
MGTKFKVKCNWCGVIGHKVSQCRLHIAGKPAQTNQAGLVRTQEMAEKEKPARNVEIYTVRTAVLRDMIFRNVARRNVKIITSQILLL